MNQSFSTLGDGICDEELNTHECQYDKGDCCKTCPGMDPIQSNPELRLCLPMNSCQFVEWVGDGICDDVTNNSDCDFDRGDCCDPEGDFSLCSNCECLNYASTWFCSQSLSSFASWDDCIDFWLFTTFGCT